MFLFLGIIAALAVLITVILLLPVRLVIKSDKNGELVFLIKYLFLCFGETKKKKKQKTKPSAGNELKKSLGIDGFNLKSLRNQIKKNGLKETLSKFMAILKDIFKELKKISKHCTVEKFKLKVVCTGDDAAATAIKYGECCALLYPAIGVLGSVLTIKERGTDVNVCCDYSENKEKIDYYFVLKISAFRLAAAMWRILFKEYKRRNEIHNKNASNPKNIVP